MNIFSNINKLILVVSTACFLAACVGAFINGGFNPMFTGLLYAGLSGLLYSLIVFAKNAFSFLRKQKSREAISLVLLAPICFGVISFIYLIADSHKVRIDLSEGQSFSLSAQTIQILKNLDEEVNIVCFVNDPGMKTVMKTKLDQYEYHSDMIKVKFYDPDKNPDKARFFNIKKYGDVVIYTEKKRKKLKNPTLESEFTNALIEVLSDDKKSIYFLSGHGEPSIDDEADSSSLGELKKQLEIENYEVSDLMLVRSEVGVPEDAACVIIASPETDFFDKELEMLRDYINNSGAVIVLGDRLLPKTIHTFISEFGVDVNDDFIIDKMSQVLGGSYETAVIAQYAQHSITKDFTLNAFFPTSSSVKLLKNREDSIQTTELAYTGPGSWAETDIAGMNERGEAALEDSDIAGPVAVAVAIEKSVHSDTEEDKDNGKMIVFGDCDFVTNSYLMISGNRDLFMNALAWACGDENLISIRPKETKATPLYLQAGQIRMLFFLSMIAMPGLFIVLGIVVVLRRKNQK